MLIVFQVILVGHSTGGACVSYALERFPEKISKAIFLCATMVSDGQRPFDVFADEVIITLANSIHKFFLNGLRNCLYVSLVLQNGS